MIVVFVVDTSPSMGEPLKGTSYKVGDAPVGISRLDLAKMTVESLTKMMDRRVHDHNLKLQSDKSPLKSLHNMGFGYSANDQFLLLSTGCQHSTQSNSAACGAGGRLLVGFGPSDNSNNLNAHDHTHSQFHSELKRLVETKWKKNEESFPEDGGGAKGLNTALSTGLQMLSRNRLQNRRTENFGQGRLPSNAMLVPNTGGGAGGNVHQASNALQSACLVLLTDGDCLTKLPSEGGGSLQLQFGNIPLREFYREPFRWDQRIFCLGVGPSASKLHPSLNAFCELTGGCHTPIRSVQDIPQVTNLISSLIAPRLPTPWPMQNPLKLPHVQTANAADNEMIMSGEVFLNGGPVCAFQVLERNSAGQPAAVHRAMLLYAPCWNNDALKSTQKNSNPLPPIWPIPESYFPSKKMESLPPRTAQPLLSYTRYYQAVGTCAFDPMKVMQMLYRLDHFVVSNRTMSHGSLQIANKLLQRDIYVCQWLSPDGRASRGPSSQRGLGHFPIFVRGGGRPALSEGEENVINIGILHVPDDHKSPSTLTFLPPDPHILLPLLLKAAEVEHRQLKKASASIDNDTGKLLNISKNLIMDDHWRSEMRAYLFRVPPYYHAILRRCLRAILPPSLHSLISTESAESALSRSVMQKIKIGEQIAKDKSERQEKSEGGYRRHVTETNQYVDVSNLRYGHYDCRSPTHQYLNALRCLPPPSKKQEEKERRNRCVNIVQNDSNETKPLSVVNCIGDLPAECLLAFYESRRRWIFGGSGLTTQGLSIDGVHCSTNSQHVKANQTIMDESLLSLIGVGASSLNNIKISKMGDFKERLLFANQPIIGYGRSDSVVSPISTSPNGSPVWSMDDDALPAALFDQTTGGFIGDSAQARARARVMINFGNPFKSRQGDSIVPEEFANQLPPTSRKSRYEAPEGSPPHVDVEGEGEAEFAGLSPPRVDPEDVGRKRENASTPISGQQKRAKIEKPKDSPNPNRTATAKVIESKKIPAPPAVRPPPRPPPPRVARPPPPKPPNKPQPNKQQPQPPKPKPQRPPPTVPNPPGKQRPKPPQPSNNSNPAMNMNMNMNMNKQHAPKPPPPAPAPLAQSPNVRPNVKLPPNWMAVWSKSKQKWYYFDKKENKSVWEWPPPGGIR